MYFGGIIVHVYCGYSLYMYIYIYTLVYICFCHIGIIAQMLLYHTGSADGPKCMVYSVLKVCLAGPFCSRAMDFVRGPKGLTDPKAPCSSIVDTWALE